MAAWAIPEQSIVRRPLKRLIWPSGKGSLGLLAMLQRGDHAWLYTPFDNLQITVQAIHQVDQQLLLQQLPCTDRTPQDQRTVWVIQGQLPVAAGIERAKRGLVGSQGIVEQSADSFHPDHSLARDM